MKLENFLNEEGKLIYWPAKKKAKIMVIEYIASKFEEGREYSEKEVNAIISHWHTFDDYFMLRRGMIDWKCMKRTRDGAIYWKNSQ